MNRLEGYYWVKYYDRYYIAYYYICENTGMWELPLNSEVLEDSDFEHINENRIKFPGELPN